MAPSIVCYFCCYLSFNNSSDIGNFNNYHWVIQIFHLYFRWEYFFCSNMSFVYCLFAVRFIDWWLTMNDVIFLTKLKLYSNQFYQTMVKVRTPFLIQPNPSFENWSKCEPLSQINLSLKIGQSAQTFHFPTQPFFKFGQSAHPLSIATQPF